MGKRKLYRETNLLVVFGVTLMAVMGVATITPAFPAMVRELNITTQEVGLLITIFTIPGVFLAPVLGILADRWGRKKILIPSLMIFGVVGGACVLARDFHTLLALRFLQGTGAASIAFLNVTIIGDLYSGKQRIAAIGYNAGVLSVGTAGYPALGGAMAMLGWYYPFLLPLVAIPIGFLALHYLNNPEPDDGRSTRSYLKSIWRTIKNPQTVVLFIIGASTFLILYGAYLTFFPFMIASSFGGSALTIGMVMASTSLTTALTAPQMGKLTKKRSGKTFLKISFLLYALGLTMITVVPNIWLLMVPTIILGIAHGLNMPNLYALLTRRAPMEHRAAFMSINGTALKLGQTLGPVLMGAVFTEWGLDSTFYVGSGMALMMFFLSAASLR